MRTGGMRRRRGKAVVKREEGRSEEKLKRHHPLRLSEEPRIMPHELPEEEFIEWKILNGMSDKAYEESVKLGDAFLADIKENGIPIPTDKLTADQRGWAKADHPEHYTNEIARWKPIPGKASKVEPYKVKLVVRDREYNEHCGCDEPDIKFWGTRWDNTPLYQCQNCGEVILSKTNAELAIAIGGELRDNDEENDNNDDN